MEFVKPVNYELTFEPNLEKFKFNGQEKILVNILKPTRKLVLNAADLKIKDCYANFNGKIVKPSIEFDNKNEEIALGFSETVNGKIEILINFEGVLNDKLVGFYRSKYEVGGKEKYLATSQFEAADARRAFPCWDNPAYKATFDVSMIIGKNLTAISNMPIIEERKITERKRLVKFAQTPVMSTYLLYLGVGEFEFIEDKLGKTVIRVATTPGKKRQGKLALEFAKKFLKFYQTYFGIKYPLPKLDIIALPDFASGAMENWGAITFREAGVLFNTKTSSTATKQYIAEVIAHEVAHQWFGDLVTMKWWNDLWLNESFATFMATKTVDHFFPEWKFWNQFLNSDTAVALGSDALKTSHPIEAKVKTPAEIGEIFDEISYQKGGSILRMLENFLGEKNFREGLKHYLAAHKYRNATTEDLWKSLGKVSHKPVREMMSKWTKQTGYPLVEARAENSNLILSQKRFLLEKTEKEDKSKWFVPLSIKLPRRNVSQLMSDRMCKIKLPANSKWFKANVGQTGFYIVKYPRQVLNNLKDLIAHKKLSNIDRWGLHNDLFALTVAGEVSIEDYFDFVNAYKNEDDYLATTSIEESLYSIYLLTIKESFSQEINGHNQQLLKKIFKILGWQPKKNEIHTNALLRGQTIIYLARMDNKEILDTAHKKFRRFLQNSSSLHADLRSAVYNSVAWQGDENTHDTLLELYRKAPTQEEKRRFLSALGGFRDLILLKKSLDFSLSSEVRYQDLFIPLLNAGANPYGREILWPWIKNNWVEICKRLGKTKFLLGRVLDSLNSTADYAVAEDLKRFFELHPEPKIKMSLTQTTERIRINAKFLENIRKSY